MVRFLHGTFVIVGVYASRQSRQTVNLLSSDFVGANPTTPKGKIK